MPTEIVTAQPPGHVHHFADKVQPWHLTRLHGLGRQLAGIDTAQRHFCRAVTFRAIGLHPPLLQAIHQLGLLSRGQLLQGRFRQLSQRLQKLNQTFRQLQRQRIFRLWLG